MKRVLIGGGGAAALLLLALVPVPTYAQAESAVCEWSQS
jgi:hypothetical protein